MTLALKNIALTFSSRISIIISAIVISVLTARFLGPAGRGEYFYIYSLAVVLANCCSLGLYTSNTHLVISYPQLLNKLIINNAWVSIFFCTVISGIIVFAIYHFTANSPWCIAFAVPLASLSLFFLLANSLFAGINKINMLNFYQFANNGLTIIAIIIVGLYAKNINMILGSVTFVWLLLACAIFFTLYNKNNKVKFKFYNQIYSLGFQYSLKSYFVGIFTLVFLRTNVFLLKELSSFIEVGYFSIACQVMDALTLLPSSIALLLFPHLVRSKSLDVAIIYSLLKKISVIILFLLLLIWYLSPVLIKFLFGINYLPVVVILRCMLPAVGCSCLIIILTQFFAARGFSVKLLLVWLFGVLINLFLSYFLILRYNAIGAAIGMSISYSLLFLGHIVLFYFEKKVKKKLATEYL